MDGADLLSVPTGLTCDLSQMIIESRLRSVASRRNSTLVMTLGNYDLVVAAGAGIRTLPHVVFPDPAN
jgi:hypothetical protein